MYVAVKGGEAAIEAAHKLLASDRRGDADVPALSLEQVEGQLRDVETIDVKWRGLLPLPLRLLWKVRRTVRVSPDEHPCVRHRDVPERQLAEQVGKGVEHDTLDAELTSQALQLRRRQPRNLVGRRLVLALHGRQR